MLWELGVTAVAHFTPFKVLCKLGFQAFRNMSNPQSSVISELWEEG
jgi:hypothetical protein